MTDTPTRTTAALPLLEREGELRELDAVVRRAAAGDGGLVVVEGAAGIGKSRLVDELRVQAGRGGLRVLAARGSDLEREFAFGVVRQLFEPLLAAGDERRRLLGGAAAAAAPVFETVSPTGGGDGSFATLHGLFWLTVNLAGDGPLLLVVDDLHWCDRPSLRFVAYLARRLEGLATVLAVSLRTAERGTDPVLVAELAGAPEAVHLHPRPLGEAGVATLVRSRLGAEPDPAFTAACRGATGGNPLLLRQLLTSLEGDGVAPRASEARAVRKVGPRAVSRTVLLRLRRLSAAAEEVAHAAAVLGDGAELPLVAALADLGEEEVAAATAELVRAEILRDERPLGFVHPLVRDAVYHELPVAERELRHARAARLLADAQASPEAVATHLRMAPRRGEAWVVDVLATAAASARAKGAADSAVGYLARALDEPPAPERRAPVLAELGLAETLTSGPSAAAHLREAWDLLEDPRRRAHVASLLARTLLFTAPARDAAAVAAKAAAETPPELLDERQALRALELAAVFYGVPNPDAIARLGDLRLEGDGPGARMLAAIGAFGRATHGTEAAACATLARWALEGGVLIEADPGLFPVAAIAVLVLADADDALAAWDPLRELAHRRGSLNANLSVNLWRGFTLLRRGDLREALSSLEAAHEHFADWGRVRSRETYGAAFLAAARVRRGELEAARVVLAGAQLQDDGGNGYVQLLVSRAELLLAEGRAEEAAAVADDLATRPTFAVHPAWAAWRSLKAQALDLLGRPEEAVALVEQELALARSFGAPSHIGRALRVLGTTLRERGLEHLREAVEVLEPSPARLELATALLALGTALRLGRRPTEAREPLRRALELADRCGADPLAAQARTELYAAGSRPRTTALRGAAALTPSERRVAELAAAGRSNKDVAQALFVTPKTVEVHLSSTYRKLGISSRRELGDALTAA